MMWWSLLVLVIGIWAASPRPVLAAPLLWSFSGLTFADGGTASGSFEFDADTLTYSSINITTTSGLLIAGTVYSLDHPDFENNALIPIVLDSPPQNAGAHILELRLNTEMTNSGGSLLIVHATEGPCFFSTVFPLCAGFDGNMPELIRTAISPVLITSSPVPIPIPTAIVIFGLGVLALATSRARRLRRSAKAARAPGRTRLLLALWA